MNLSHHVLMRQLLFAASRLCTQTASAIHYKWISAHESNNVTSKNINNSSSKSSSSNNIGHDDKQVYE